MLTELAVPLGDDVGRCREERQAEDVHHPASDPARLEARRRTRRLAELYEAHAVRGALERALGGLAPEHVDHHGRFRELVGAAELDGLVCGLRYVLRPARCADDALRAEQLRALHG